MSSLDGSSCSSWCSTKLVKFSTAMKPVLSGSSCRDGAKNTGPLTLSDRCIADGRRAEDVAVMHCDLVISGAAETKRQLALRDDASVTHKLRAERYEDKQELQGWRRELRQ